MDPKRMEKVATDVQAVRLVTGEEAIVFEIPYPKGHAIVELRDARTGRVVDRQEKTNFLSQIYGMHVRSWQRALFGILYNNPAAQTWRAPIFYPNQFVAVWNDATAENSSTEHRVVTDGNGIIAFAARVPTTISSATRRGTPNITESVSTDSGESMVYDWPTSAGNGTFQSLGYTAFNAGDAIGRLACQASLLDRRFSNQAAVKLAGAGGIVTTFGAGANHGQAKVNVAGDLIIPIYDSVSSTITFVALASGWRGTPGTYDEYNEGDLTYGGTLTAPTPVSMSGFSGAIPAFAGEALSRYWMVMGGTSGALRLRGCNKTTLAVEVTPADTPDTGTAANALGCIIGTDAFVTAVSNNNVGKVYRYDLTGGPPTVTATITLAYPSGMTPTTVTDMITNGTDLIIWASTGIFRFNTSGTVLEWYGLPNANTVVETLATPFAGTAGLIGLPFRDQTLGVRWDQSGMSTGNFTFGTTSPTFTSPTHGMAWTGLAWYDGKLFLTGGNLAGNTASDKILYGWAEAGWNLGSRVLLGSPSTKTSSQTMKITYNVTLPDM